MASPQYQPYDNEERLNRLYWQAGLTQGQIADLHGVSKKDVRESMYKHDIETRHGPQKQRYARYSTYNGYERWEEGNKTVYVHQLLTIADGADPHKVFSNGEYVIHHKNGVRWDNRPENVEVVTCQEHGRIHAERGDTGCSDSQYKYTEEELSQWIDSFVRQFGFVPSKDDIKGWPGPSSMAYVYRYGSWKNAIRAVGYTPRSEQGDGS
jgi:hypothetical protein